MKKDMAKLLSGAATALGLLGFVDLFYLLFFISEEPSSLTIAKVIIISAMAITLVISGVLWQVYADLLDRIEKIQSVDHEPEVSDEVPFSVSH